MNATAIDTFVDFFRSGWSARRFGSWVLACDTATMWWARAEDITAEIMDAAEAIRDRNDGASSEAWEYLCSSIRGYHDDSVDAETLAAAREWLGRGDDDTDPIASGW